MYVLIFLDILKATIFVFKIICNTEYIQNA